MKLAIVALALSLSFNAYADGSRAGNGGDGVFSEESGELYLLDLYEEGVHGSPFFDLDIDVDPVIIDRARGLFRNLDLSEEVRQLFLHKLSEINRYDTYFARVMIDVAQMYNWRLVDWTLVDIDDENALVELEGYEMVQLAIRRGKRIFVSRKYWEIWGDQNAQKVALLFHEILYALINPEPVVGSDSYRQVGWKVREVVGYLFSERMSLRGREGFEEVFGRDFQLTPSLPGLPRQIVDLSRVRGGKLVGHDGYIFDLFRVGSVGRQVRVGFGDYGRAVRSLCNSIRILSESDFVNVSSFTRGADPTTWEYYHSPVGERVKPVSKVYLGPSDRDEKCSRENCKQSVWRIEYKDMGECRQKIEGMISALERQLESFPE